MKNIKKIIQSAVAVAMACLLAGCETTGLSPRERSGVSYPNYILSLQSDGTNAPRKVITPIRLAVAQVGEAAPSDAMLNKLAASKTLVSSAFGLPLPGDEDNFRYYNRRNDPPEDYTGRIKAVRGLARAAGADYLFLCGGNIDSWQKRNPSAILDFTIIGGVVAPGTQIHVEGKGAGALIDVATGQPIIFVNAETNRSALSPDFLVDGKTTSMRVQARDELVGKLSDELLEKLTALTPTVTSITR